MSSSNKRRDVDVTKLMMNDFKVETTDDNIQLFHVIFNGPENSPYHGSMWRIMVELPDDYPFMPPTVTFVNKIYHPNIDEISGKICLDAIGQNWSPMAGATKLFGTFSSMHLVNVFETFLPQLLLYPNPSDPLNSAAAELMNEDPEAYEQRVKAYCEKYAKPEDLGVAPALKEESSDKELSEDDHDSSTEAVAGQDDP